ncbi:hypothetical protein [Rufibacter hautae]|nr:hypothetical protein [Rufibacter hautae]
MVEGLLVKKGREKSLPGQYKAEFNKTAKRLIESLKTEMAQSTAAKKEDW